ncbi:hypothetical protein SLEP1_g39468 [Rubroshorea leprosula]|uniref:Transposase (putative) gypsy type domain-containing protein n=1 Tax=Rubroshorea leprosula TaxID=152421 RepID=A0AAV5L0A3_9ROSI|nr:hypothetical protein SLEP1_g39468 [Rubroshorea leprosula]
MDSFQDLRELRGNQGKEEEEGVILVEPITMIVLPELQDLPETIILESSVGSSAGGDSGNHYSSASRDSSTKGTPSDVGDAEEGVLSSSVTSTEANVVAFEEWENKVISRRLDNLRKAPKTLFTNFRFRAALHHDVVDNSATVKGVCTVSRTGWVPVYVDYFDADLRFPLHGLIFDVLAKYELALTQLTPNSIKFVIGFIMLCARLEIPAKAVVFKSLFLCRICPSTSGTSWRNEQHTREATSASTKLEELWNWVWFPKLVAARTSNVLPALAHVVAEPLSASASIGGPKITYLEGFSYLKANFQATIVQGMQNFVPYVDWQRAKRHIQQHGDHAAMLKLMDVFSYAVPLFECEQGARRQNHELKESRKQLTSDKASLEDKVNELKEKLEKAQAERNNDIQAAKDEADCAKNRSKRAEADMDQAFYELNSLKDRRFVCIGWAQGVEWLVGADMFQDVVAITSANTTTDIYNEIRGKVLWHRADFPIGELAFFEGEEMDEQGKSLAPPADATMRLRWELNEEGVLVWPSSIVEKREDTEGLISFDAWVVEPFEVEAEPSSIPPSSQPAIALALPSPTRSSPTHSSFARASVVPVDASIPVDLTDD